MGAIFLSFFCHRRINTANSCDRATWYLINFQTYGRTPETTIPENLEILERQNKPKNTMFWIIWEMAMPVVRASWRTRQLWRARPIRRLRSQTPALSRQCLMSLKTNIFFIFNKKLPDGRKKSVSSWSEECVFSLNFWRSYKDLWGGICKLFSDKKIIKMARTYRLKNPKPKKMRLKWHCVLWKCALVVVGNLSLKLSQHKIWLCVGKIFPITLDLWSFLISKIQ